MKLIVYDFAYFLFTLFCVLPQAKGHVFANAHGIKQGRILEYHPHVQPHLVHLILIQRENILAIDKNFAARRLLQAYDEP